MAAITSLLVARALGLPEAYWAPVTTIVVMQSTLGAALVVSGQRLAGTALGAAAGGLLATYFGSNLIAFSAGLFCLGLLCAVRLDKAAYRFAGVTLVIVMLIKRVDNPWKIATHRFIEVSIGIAVGLIITAIWPERQPVGSSTQSGK